MGNLPLVDSLRIVGHSTRACLSGGLRDMHWSAMHYQGTFEDFLGVFQIGILSAIFTKGNNFCDFLFAIVQYVALQS